MEQQLIYHILGIEPTKDEKAVRTAYLHKLKSVNPEDDPEGFKRLREAYEEAAALARTPGTETEEHEKTDIELWIDRVDRIYRDIRTRRIPENWDEVLSDPLCCNLDTSIEVRDALLHYLMEHMYLPHAVWKKIDDTFQILADIELLVQRFPEDFLNYVMYYTRNPSFINYDLFEVCDESRMDADAYIRGYLDIRLSVDRGATERMTERLQELDTHGIYHPYQLVEALRVLMTADDKAPADQLSDKLLAGYGTDNYVRVHCAEAKWAAGKRETAEALWRQILAENPHHHMAKSGLIRCLLTQENYKEAKEQALELLDIDEQDRTTLEYLHQANEALIRIYKEQIADPSCEEAERMESTMELLWCLYQNEHLDEALALLEKFAPDEQHRYSYENLSGRLLYAAGQYERALPHLKIWLEMIDAAPEDGSEENIRRKEREPLACDLISRCLYEQKEFEQAIAYSDRAIETASDTDDMMSYMRMKAKIYFAAGKYELCIDVCDQILQVSDQYFPAYVQRQEAAYELRRGQQVIDDYYRAIRVYDEYYKPYLLAAEVFYYHDQYKEAKRVLDKAQECNVEFSPRMKLFQVKILRNLAENQEDRAEALRLVRALADEVRDAETDIEDVSEIPYETGLLHWDNGDLEQALAYIKEASSQNPRRCQYHLIMGHINYDQKEYRRALEEYDLAEPDYQQAPTLPYHRGLCYEALGEKETARECYEKTVAIQEDYDEALEKLANYYKARYTSYCDRKDFDKALEYLNRQLAVQENCYYLVERGRLYMTAYELEAAIRDFKKALEYAETDWAAFNNIGCCYKYMGQFERAIEYFNRAQECLGEKKSVLPYSNMADCYEALGDYRKAIECYEKDLELFPDRDTFRVEIGQLYTYLGEYENALKYFEMVPDDEDYYTNISEVYVYQNKYEEAVRILKKGIEQAKGEDKTTAFYELACYYKNYKYDFPKAEYYFKKALSHAGTEYKLYETEWRLAELYFRMGRLEDAKLYGERGLEHFRRSDRGTEEDYLGYGEYRPARLMRHGWLYIAAGETEKGLDYFRQMLSCTRCRQCRHRECFESYLYLGWYCEAVGEPEKALEYYQKGLNIVPYSLTLRSSIAMVEKRIKQASGNHALALRPSEDV